jgi:hypothetical protein
MWAICDSLSLPNIYIFLCDTLLVWALSLQWSYIKQDVLGSFRELPFIRLRKFTKLSVLCFVFDFFFFSQE